MARCSCGSRLNSKRLCANCDLADSTPSLSDPEFQEFLSGKRDERTKVLREEDMHRISSWQYLPESQLPPRPQRFRHMGGQIRKFAKVGVFLVLVPVLALPTAVIVSSPSPIETLQSSAGYIDWFASSLALVQPQEKRLLPKVQTELIGEYALMKDEETGEPYLFDPCRPIYWVVNPNNEPARARTLLKAAFAQISRHSGLKFVYSGETDEEWNPDRDLANTTYPNINSEWNPVVVWYLKESDFQEASSQYGYIDAAGFAGPEAIESRGVNRKLVSVSGTVTLDATWTAKALRQGLEQDVWWVLAHEIGHVIGLDHVEDDTHLMSEDGASYEEFAPGDLQGLSVVGGQDCLKSSEYPRKSDYSLSGPS